jgi:DNA-binding HxlR family transcriptional regulator
MNTKERAIEEKICPLEFAVNAISENGKFLSFGRLMKVKTASEFIKGIGKVDRRVLNQQLKEMESAGLLTKVSIPSCHHV